MRAYFFQKGDMQTGCPEATSGAEGGDEYEEDERYCFFVLVLLLVLGIGLKGMGFIFSLILLRYAPGPSRFLPG